MAELVNISLRIEQDVLDIIRDREDSASEAIRKVLRKTYFPESVIDDLDTTDYGIKEIGFRLPVGDVICYNTGFDQTQLWWCPKDRLLDLSELAKPWTENGFSYHVGSETGGTWYSPEVILDGKQERGRNKQFSPGCKGQTAHVGDRLIWLEIRDAGKALDFMDRNTNIPCAVRCDIHRYSEDLTYKDAFDRSQELFIYYWANGRSMRTSTSPLSKSDVIRMFDL